MHRRKHSENDVTCIVHPNTRNTYIREIKLCENFNKANHRITRRFLVEFTNAIPVEHVFSLFIGEVELFRTDKLVYDRSYNMWEIIFYTEMMAIGTNIPFELSNALFLNLVTYHKVKIQTNVKCTAYLEYYDDVDIPEFAMKSVNWTMASNKTPENMKIPVRVIEAYVKYATTDFNISTNILKYACGMAGMKFAHAKRKYLDETGVIDIAHKYCNDSIVETRLKYGILTKPKHMTLIIGGKSTGKILCRQIMRQQFSKENTYVYTSLMDGDDYVRYGILSHRVSNVFNNGTEKRNIVFDEFDMSIIDFSTTLNNVEQVIVVIDKLTDINNAYIKLFDNVFVWKHLANENIKSLHRNILFF